MIYRLNHERSFLMNTREAALEAALREARSMFVAFAGDDRSAMIQRIDAALDLPPNNQVERLCEALREVSDDCEEWVKGYYIDHEKYPMETRRYNRDMGAVNRSRALLAEIEAAILERKSCGSN